MTNDLPDNSRRVFIGIGSNMGDRKQYLRDAVGQLRDVVRVSPLYETEPIGGPSKQGQFLNAVVELFTPISGHELLQTAQRCEQRAKRVRVEKNGPRTLDVDILWIDGESIQSEDLVVPHPLMFERRFVMQPLADLAPDLVPSDWRDRVSGEVKVVGSL